MIARDRSDVGALRAERSPARLPIVSPRALLADAREERAELHGMIALLLAIFASYAARQRAALAEARRFAADVEAMEREVLGWAWAGNALGVPIDAFSDPVRRALAAALGGMLTGAEGAAVVDTGEGAASVAAELRSLPRVARRPVRAEQALVALAAWRRT
jgi:hypothetical protein